MEKECKTATKEQLATLYTNMGDMISSMFPFVLDCINTYNELQIIKNRKEIAFLWEDLVRLQYFVCFSLMDLYSSLRADFKTEIEIEKRIHLKYVNVIIVEVYKALFGFGKSKKQALWTDFKKDIKIITDNGLEDRIKEIDKLSSQFEELYYPSCFLKDSSRDFAVHYNYDAIRVYDYIVSISEKEETDKAIEFMKILQSVSSLIKDIISNFRIPLAISISNNRRLPEIEATNVFPDKDGKMLICTSHAIQLYSKTLDQIVSSYRLPEKVSMQFKIKIDISDYKSLTDTSNPALTILYIYIDICAAVLAYLRSEYYIEKQLHLRHLNVIVYEGLKKLYGFPGTQSKGDKLLWKEYLYPILISFENQDIVTQANEIENELKRLSKHPFINDEDLRNLSVHIRDKKRKDYIPRTIERLISFSAKSEITRALLLMKILPSILNLSKEVLAYESVQYNKDRREKREAMLVSFVQLKQRTKDEKTKEMLEKVIKDLSGLINHEFIA